MNLKDRKDDIIPLARKALELAKENLSTGPKELSLKAEEHLLNYDWPGDEKELEVAVLRACVISNGPMIEAADFDIHHRQAKSIAQFIELKLKGFMRNIKRFEKFNLYEMVIPEVEKSLILMVLKETKGNQLRASRLLGINRNTLRSKIRKLGIKVKSK